MKNKIQYLLFSLLFIAIAGCSDDDGLDTVTSSDPTNISVDFNIEQDNSGEVTLYPSAENANSFVINYGDGSEISEEIATGDNVMHTYEEGTYQVEVTAMNLAGEPASITQTLEVSFRAPENLDVTITKDASNPFIVNVTASADYAAAFEVYFGDVTDEDPTMMMIGETLTHEYANIGSYTITVIALSGGEETTTYTEVVEIVDPLLLPVTFESQTVAYTFYNFGGGEGTGVPTVTNPASDAVNDSQNVGAYTKVAGAETWAGTVTTLNEPIDFTSTTTMAIDVYSPAAGVPVLFKIEDTDDAENNFVEVQATTTVANQWETLVFDFSAIDASLTYENLVLFFNYEIAGTGETYYFDNIRMYNPVFLELPITFDDPAVNYTFTTFNGASYNVIQNPDLSGSNTDQNLVGEIVNAGVNWEGGSFNLGVPVDFSSSDKTITMDFWANTPVSILLKFEGGVNGERENEVTVNHTGSGWEEISFDFANDAVKSYIDGNQGVGDPFVPTGQYSTMTIFVDGAGTTAGSFYVDNITKEGAGASNQPTSGAPDPQLPASDVISMFSDVYNDVPVATWATSWSNATYAEVSIAGNPTKEYSALDFVGIETPSPYLDASSMTHFHTDVWTADATQIRIKLVDFGADGAFGGGDDVEHEVAIDNFNQGEWIQLDIPLSDFTNLTTTGHIGQLIYSGNPTGAHTIYVDNIYFHN